MMKVIRAWVVFYALCKPYQAEKEIKKDMEEMVSKIDELSDFSEIRGDKK